MIEKILGFFSKVIQKIGDFIAKKRMENRELHQLPDEQLKTLAIQEGSGFMGGMNRYEKELIRREKEKIWLDNKVKEAKEPRRGFF